MKSKNNLSLCKEQRNISKKSLIDFVFAKNLQEYGWHIEPQEHKQLSFNDN